MSFLGVLGMDALLIKDYAPTLHSREQDLLTYSRILATTFVDAKWGSLVCAVGRYAESL